MQTVFLSKLMVQHKTSLGNGRTMKNTGKNFQSIMGRMKKTWSQKVISISPLIRLLVIHKYLHLRSIFLYTQRMMKHSQFLEKILHAQKNKNNFAAYLTEQSLLIILKTERVYFLSPITVYQKKIHQLG